MKFLSQINVNTEYALPIVDGANGQVLTTDGSGAVYWGSVSIGALNLDGLQDVVITTPTSGQILRYGIPVGSGDQNPVWYNWTPNFVTTANAVTITGTQTITGSKTFTAATTMSIASGNDVALTITKGGSHEALYINKTSGSGNAVTIVGTLEATTIVKTGGTSSQFLKADGSVDTNTYLTSYTETQTLDAVTDLGNTTTNAITVGGLTSTSVTTPLIESSGLLIIDADTSGGLQPDQGDPAVPVLSFDWQGSTQGYIDTDGKITFNGFKTPSGTSSQFLKANGTVDSNVYITSAALSGYATQTWVNSNFYNQGQIDDFFYGNEPILGYNKTNWDTAYDWGNHDEAGYLTSFTETDPTVPDHVKAITETQISDWDRAYNWGNHADYGYAPIASPSFTGTPSAPTAAAGTNTTQIATTAFVRTEITNLVDAAPATLDTLNELAAALGDDPNFATTVADSIATKVPQTRTLTINGTALDLSADRSWTIDSADGYVSNVRLVETTLTFEGEGNAFAGDIDLSTLPFAPQGSYLTAEADTLATVTSRGATTNGNIVINGDATIQNSGYLRLIAGSSEMSGFTVFNSAQNGYLSNRITTSDHSSGWGWELTSSTATDTDAGVYFRIGYGGAVSYLNSGNFGIGKTNPTYTLDVGGSLRTTGSITVDSGNQITLDQNYTVHGYLQFSAATFGGESAFGMYGYYGIALNTRQGAGVIIRGDSGNVGIGTDNPQHGLHVSKNQNQVAAFQSPNANTWIDIISTAGTWSMGATSSNTWAIYQRGAVNATEFEVSESAAFISGEKVATQDWVTSQGYLTSETDSQTLDWNQGEKTLTISNGNTVTLEGLAAEDFVTSQGYITGYAETDPVYTSERDSLLLNKTIQPTLLFSTLEDYNKPSGYSTMIQPSSYQNPLPSHGYYHIIARRDTGGGYGALLQSYNTHELYHGNTTQNTSDISWYKIWTSGDFTSTNVTNWNTAYGWGNNYISDVRLSESNLEFTGEGSAFTGTIDLSGLPFQPAGSYLTAEADTLATVTGRGATTNTAVNFGANGGAVNLTGLGSHISFKDQDNIWNGYVGFDGNTGRLEFPGRNLRIVSGYNGTIELNTGVSGYNSGRIHIPQGYLSVDNNYVAATAFHGQSIKVGTAGSTPTVDYGIFHHSGIGLGIASGAGGSTQGISFWSHNGSSFFESVKIAGSTGNVGIGTTAPDTPLFVQGGPAGTGGWNRTATLSATYPGLIFNSNGTKWGGMAYDYSAAMRFWVNASNNDIFAGTLAMSILNNGNVGIGDTNPVYKLDVNGTGRFNGQLRTTQGGRTLFLGDGAYANHINVDSNVDFAFNYNNGNTGGFGFFGGGTVAKFFVSNSGVITAFEGNSTNWNKAYGWGDHDGLYAGIETEQNLVDLAGSLGSAAYEESTSFASASHTHDDRYYTETESDARYHRKDGPVILTSRGTDSAGSAAYAASVPVLADMLNNTALELHSGNDEPVTIYFKSTVNAPSDFAYISFDPDYDNSGENAALVLGVENDGAGSSDYIRLQGRVSTVVDYISSEASVIQDWVYQGTQVAYLDVSGNLQVDGTITASGGNSTNWNTAYGWGNHADVPYWNVELTDGVTVAASSVRFGGNVRVDGDLEVLGTITETSSIRFKENITPLAPSLDKVNQLEAVSYNKIGVDDREIGLIAEDVAELFPEVVTYNEEGQPQGIQYQRLSVILLKAVQELTERVNKLENK